MDNIILALRKRTFKPFLTFQMLLVALTRVPLSKNIRVLNLLPGENLGYLQNLTYDEDLEIWLAGFNEEGIWSKDLSIKYFKKNTDASMAQIKISFDKKFLKLLSKICINF